ncbi:hypothetical protein QQS21_009533 [Conoideocrella luteorostrata]|uniref:Pyrroline-5-carboxylate reductase n=1 Tax=Conoideocrella luteorostrata TaxID=1105319 RepID=A0AAJ0CL58_9HYPO|nr:hypothetical protein QQS21_009533 [Conoideocrella luteorostrata]
MAASLTGKKLAFVGGGNMAAAIIGGLIKQGVDTQNICVSEPWAVTCNKLSETGVKTTLSNTKATIGADVVIIAVKPQVAKAVCEELGKTWTGAPVLPVVVSNAAGITLDTTKQWLTTGDGKVPHVVRAMPNTPALLGEGASGIYAGSEVAPAERTTVTILLRSVGKTVEWVAKEELLDVVTGISGSGPAYFFGLVEHLVASAVALVVSQEQATRLVAQTCLGAGKMLVESLTSPAQLRINVTSLNGTTDAALRSFQTAGFQDIVDMAVRAAVSRAAELSDNARYGMEL